MNVCCVEYSYITSPTPGKKDTRLMFSSKEAIA